MNRLRKTAPLHHRAIVATAAVWFVCMTAGCAPSWHGHSKTFLAPYENGNHDAAVLAATKCAKAGVNQDKVILRLEQGAILRAAGRLEASNAAFDDAHRLVGNYEQWPVVRISEEAVASIGTVRTINYRGHLSDLIMLNAYRALNDMELGNLDSARVTLIRAQFVQSDIADRYNAALAKAQEDLDKKKKTDRYDLQRTLDAVEKDGRTVTERLEQDHYQALSEMDAYASFVNPFCDYLQGMFFLAAGEDSSDLERAASAFKRVDAMVPGNPYVEQDVAEAERVANGGQPAPVTYVLFETGMAPEREQTRIPLPLFLLNGQAPSVVLYLPTISPRGGHVTGLTATADGQEFPSTVVCDMDAVIMQEFKNQLPTLVTRMLIGAATKAALNYAANQAVKDQNQMAKLAVHGAAFLYQAAMNHADLRTWRTLPKQFHVARMPTPADGKLTLNLDSGGGAPIPVELTDAGPVHVVYVKSVRQGVTPVVRQFVLGAGMSNEPIPPASIASGVVEEPLQKDSK